MKTIRYLMLVFSIVFVISVKGKEIPRNSFDCVIFTLGFYFITARQGKYVNRDQV
jgi:hypothetical protein